MSPREAARAHLDYLAGIVSDWRSSDTAAPVVEVAERSEGIIRALLGEETDERAEFEANRARIDRRDLVELHRDIEENGA